MEILNYKSSPHFIERINQRQIDPFLVSMCLIKGEIKICKRKKMEFTLTKEKVKKAIGQGYLSVKDCLGLVSLTVVTRSNILITAFVKYGDTGITNIKIETDEY